MRTIARYSKAYPLVELRKFNRWAESAMNAREEETAEAGPVVRRHRELHPDSFVYLHENYTVTDGIFLHENILFDSVGADWIEFCTRQLAFEIPGNSQNAIGEGVKSPISN